MDTNPKRQAWRKDGLFRNRKGAVLPEFAVVVMPLLLCFFCFAQIALAACAKMAVRHSASVAVRAAVVSYGPDHDGPAERNDGLARQAAQKSLGLWDGPVQISGVVVESLGSAGGGPTAELRVNVTAIYSCGVALGARIVCDGGVLTINESSHMVNQGARYIR